MGLVHLEGRHGGEEIALGAGVLPRAKECFLGARRAAFLDYSGSSQAYLRHTFPSFSRRIKTISVPEDRYQGRTDVSALVLEQRSDSGGGIPTAGRRMGTPRGPWVSRRGGTFG